jgi:hypothetical protein
MRSALVFGFGAALALGSATAATPPTEAAAFEIVPANTNAGQAGPARGGRIHRHAGSAP